jgi:hypothetical protein
MDLLQGRAGFRNRPGVMLPVAKILIHKASMPVARHAVRTFTHGHARLFRELEIHSDGSLSDGDRRELSKLATGMPLSFVEPEDRRVMMEPLLGDYPRTKAFLDGWGYRAKLELPLVATEPYFYFDSDIVWLRPCSNLVGDVTRNIFSTESWTWYPGIRKSAVWVKSGIPRRVNSGFYFLKDPFPLGRMERLLSEGLYEPGDSWATDQEIMAFLFSSMLLYHPDDLMRSRRGMIYNLSNLKAAALHFPGRMWEPHLDQMEQLLPVTASEEFPLPRLLDSAPLGFAEILRMQGTMALAESKWARIPAEVYRRLRAAGAQG